MKPKRKYSIIYHQGKQIDLSTRMKSGRAFVDGEYLQIKGKNALTVPHGKMSNLKLYRHHGVGSMIRCELEGQMFFITVVRINLFGYFSIINFFGTRKLFNELNDNRIAR